MNIASKLWDLSNAIAGFAIFQALAYAYCFKDEKFPPQVHDFWCQIEIGIVVVAIVYVAVIVWLNRIQLRLLDRDSPDIERRVTNLACGLRIGAILGMNCLIFYLTWVAGHATFPAPKCKEPASCDAGST